MLIWPNMQGSLHSGSISILQHPSERLGTLGLCTFALFAFLSPAAANAGLLLMLLALFSTPLKTCSRFRQQPIAWLAALAFLTPFLFTAVGYQRAPEGWGPTLWDSAFDLSKLSLFVLPAWWMSRGTRRIELCLLLALVGFLVGRLLEIDPAAPLGVLSHRDGLGFPAIAFGQYSAVALLGSLLALPRAHRIAEPKLRWALIGLLSVAAAASFVGTIGAQSRGVWLAGLLVVFALGFRALRRELKEKPAVVKLLALPAALAMPLAFGAVSYVAFPDMIAARLAAEQQTIEIILSGDFDQVSGGSIGARVQMTVLGVEKWLERPFLGWGAGSSQYLLADAGLGLHPDLHNLYLELLVSFGIVGFSIYALLFVAVARALWRASRAALFHPNYVTIVSSSLAIHLLVALSNYRAPNIDWRFFFLLFLGAAFAPELIDRGQRSNQTPSTTPACEGGRRQLS